MNSSSVAERLRCRISGRRASALAMEGRAFPASLAAHVDRCLTCQVKVAHARAQRRALVSLRLPIERAPVDMVKLVLADLDAPLPARQAGSRLVPTVAAAAAAAALALLVIRRRAAA